MQKMKTLALRVSGTAAVMSAFGFSARWMQTISIFDEKTGLAESGALSSYLVVLLILGTAAVLAFLLLPTLSLGVSDCPAADIRSDDKLYRSVCAVLGGAMCVAGALIFLGCAEQSFPTLYRVLSVLAIFSGCGIIYTGLKGKAEADSPLASLFTLVPVFFGCFWIIVSYKSHSANPVVWQYAIEILAIAASTLAIYLMAGFVYCRPRIFATAFMNGLAALFCFMSLGDTRAMAFQIIFACLGIYFIVTDYYLISGLDPARGSHKHLKED